MLGHGDKVALVYVLRACDDLHGLARADVDLADPHVVGVRVARDGHDAADDDIAQLGIEPLIGLDLLTGDGHGLDKLPIRHAGEIHEFFVEPFSVQFHCSTSSELRKEPHVVVPTYKPLIGNLSGFWSRRINEKDRLIYTMAMRSRPMPKAKPEYFFGSMPQPSSTFGCTIPAPSSSIQPSPWQVEQT